MSIDHVKAIGPTCIGALHAIVGLVDERWQLDPEIANTNPGNVGAIICRTVALALHVAYRSLTQKMNFSANWKFRIGSLPPNALPLIRPAFGFGLPGTPTSESGFQG